MLVAFPRALGQQHAFARHGSLKSVPRFSRGSLGFALQLVRFGVQPFRFHSQPPQ